MVRQLMWMMSLLVIGLLPSSSPIKVNLLLRMLPTEAEAETKMRHVTGEMIGYSELREIIDAWIVQCAPQHLETKDTN